MKALTILLLIIISTSSLHAKADNYNLDFGVELLQQSIDSLKKADSPTNFKPYKLILPSSLIVIGSLPLFVSKANELDMRLSEMVSSGHGKLHFDDYLLCSPIAIMWGLDAFGGEMKPYHNFKDQTAILLVASLTMLTVVQGTKELVGRRRPDATEYTSFPSGHTAIAFMGAEMLHQEYGHYSPWISAAGYSLATLTAYMRVYNERHYIGDIVAGAGIGILCTRWAYWVTHKIEKWLFADKSEYDDESYNATLTPYSANESYGLNLSITF